jgi:hypothetical protein
LVDGVVVEAREEGGKGGGECSEERWLDVENVACFVRVEGGEDFRCLFYGYVGEVEGGAAGGVLWLLLLLLLLLWGWWAWLLWWLLLLWGETGCGAFTHVDVVVVEGVCDVLGVFEDVVVVGEGRGGGTAAGGDGQHGEEEAGEGLGIIACFGYACL